MGIAPGPKANTLTTPTHPTVLPSVEDATPWEQGGPIARTGFNYQDEIAVGLLLDMLEEPFALEVHCETHDDVILVSQGSSTQNIAEDVQVKGSAEVHFNDKTGLSIRVCFDSLPPAFYDCFSCPID